MVLNQTGEVWMGQRPVIHNDEFSEGDKRWQMPQGGIDEGEEPQAAAMRELWEETGIKSATMLGETNDWLYYDLPKKLIGVALRGRWRGQKQKWFAVRFEGDESEINIDSPPNGAPVEFNMWEWVSMDEVTNRVVDFKLNVYEQVVAQFKHLS